MQYGFSIFRIYRILCLVILLILFLQNIYTARDRVATALAKQHFDFDYYMQLKVLWQ